MKVTREKSGMSGTAATASKLAEPFARQLGLSLWDVRFVKEGSSWVLRFIIDKPDGVSLDDCENLSRAIDGPLDDADFITQTYLMEVSSPGLNRELTRPWHFESMAGRPVRLRRMRPLDGAWEHEGVLTGLENGDVCIDGVDGLLRIARQALSSVRLDDELSQQNHPEHCDDNTNGGTRGNG